METLFNLYNECTGVSTDTRTVLSGNLFVCLKGEHYDANDYIHKAIEGGAKHVISSVKEKCNGKNIHYVEDTLRFLQKLANHHRNKFEIPVIGITGSNGKTTTKELIYAVLSQEKNTLATHGNLNNHIGVPLTLLKLNASHEIAIIEMGANKPGDIAELCEIANPTHGIITNIGKAHLEGFGNFEGVLSTKTALYRSIRDVNGTLFYNSEDIHLCSNLPQNTTNIGYSTKPNTSVQGQIITASPCIEMSYSIGTFESGMIRTHLFGDYNFFNFLAAISIGNYFGISHAAIRKGIETYVPSNNRSQIEKTDRNTLIVDCYNANPSSMISALNSFSKVETLDKIVILGDMLELGADAFAEHQGMLSLCNSLNLEYITVGALFSGAGSLNGYENVQELISSQKPNSFEGKTILLKGSRGIGLEQLLTFL